jgi:CheY-like chemotaxis protein
VLLVEDDGNIRSFERAVLEECGYEVLEAENGAVALVLVAQWPPDVIVLDINMPVMDGVAFAAAYGGLPGPHAPILVTTAAGFASVYGSAVGAAAALGKPFDLDDLCEEVARLAPGDVFEPALNRSPA